MSSFLKPGKVVILLQGRHAGKKAVIVKLFKPSQSRPYPQALVVGINRYPKPVHKNMPATRIKSRSKVTPFLKLINLTHLLPTRYVVHNLDAVLNKVDIESYAQATRAETKKIVKQHIQKHYYAGNNKWFYTPLRF